ncbi:MAG: outer membrane lipoprotein carrier protein LolA [Ignavibacteria bacterium]|nr:outer membrane lipoprotein carrier protein LolA [Ignavibacteria bacterium]
MKKISLLVVFIPFIFYSIALAQPDAQQKLDELQSKFDSIKDLSADITQSVGGKANLTGKIFYQKENKLRFEFKNILIVSDGETSWNYNKRDNKVIVTNFENEGTNILSIEELIYEYPKECDISSYEFEGQTVLEFVPNSSTLNFSSIKLWINEEHLVTRALFEDPATGLVQIDLSNYRLNSNLPANYFSFKPPVESEIIDLR